MPVEMPIGAPMIIENLARNFFGLRSQWVLWAKIIDVLGAAEKEQENMHQMVLITCTEGQYACLRHKFVAEGLLGSDVLALSLQRAVAPKHQVFRHLNLATRISSFLVE